MANRSLSSVTWFAKDALHSSFKMSTKVHKILVVLALIMISFLYIKYEYIQTQLASIDFKVHGRSASISWRMSTVEILSSTTTARTFLVGETGYYFLPDVEANEEELAFKAETNIFFIITTKFQAGLAKLTPRQACAIESAARTNPTWKVYVLFASATGFSFFNSANIRPLIPIGNVHLKRLNMSTFGIGTPLWSLLIDGTLNSSYFPVEHTADVLRLLTVYKYGGTYLDTDVVVMRPFDVLPLNYLVSGADGFAANGIIRLAATGVGHTIAELFVREAADHFNGTGWGINGPLLVTRVLQKFCNITSVDLMTREQCGGEFEILPPQNFFQVFYPQHVWYFEANHTEEVMQRMKDRVLTHVWNALSKGIKLHKDSKAAYIELAKRYCPAVLRNCDDEF